MSRQDPNKLWNVHHFVGDDMTRSDAGLVEIEELNEVVNDALSRGDRKGAVKAAAEVAAAITFAPAAWAVLEQMERYRRGVDRVPAQAIFDSVSELLERRDAAAGGKPEYF